MRTIQVTGGYSGTVSGQFKDSAATDPWAATIKVALIDPDATPPSPGSAAWLTPVIDSTDVGLVRFHFTVNSSNAPGTFRVVGQVTAGGTTELVWSDNYVRLV